MVVPGGDAFDRGFQQCDDAAFAVGVARPAGSMNPRALLVFKPDIALGSAPSHKLFDAVKATRKPDVEVACSFADYEVVIDESAIPSGVTLIRRI
jgi:hypothetical protein